MFVTLTNDNDDKERFQIARIESIQEDPEGEGDAGGVLIMASGKETRVLENPEQIERLCGESMVAWSMDLAVRMAREGARVANEEIEKSEKGLF